MKMRSINSSVFPAGFVALAVLICGCGGGDKQKSGPARIADAPVESLETKSLDLGDGVTLELVRVPAGRVRIGSPETEPDRDDWEGPQRVVHFSKGFWIGKYEVTQAQYKKLMDQNPSRFAGDDRPVEWMDTSAMQPDVAALLKKLASVTSLPVRLPTEAEWEYACRAPGKQQRDAAEPLPLSAYSYGASHLGLRHFGWVDESGGRTHPVGELTPNRFGLFDMYGNVAELCSDKFDKYPGSTAANIHLGKGYPVVRGGGWASRRADCRSASRTFRLPDLVAAGSIGLRVLVPIE